MIAVLKMYVTYMNVFAALEFDVSPHAGTIA